MSSSSGTSVTDSRDSGAGTYVEDVSLSRTMRIESADVSHVSRKRAYAPRPYVASSCTDAVNRFRPVRLVPAGGMGEIVESLPGSPFPPRRTMPGANWCPALTEASRHLCVPCVGQTSRSHPCTPRARRRPPMSTIVPDSASAAITSQPLALGPSISRLGSGGRPRSRMGRVGEGDHDDRYRFVARRTHPWAPGAGHANHQRTDGDRSHPTTTPPPRRSFPRP